MRYNFTSHTTHINTAQIHTRVLQSSCNYCRVKATQGICASDITFTAYLKKKYVQSPNIKIFCLEAIIVCKKTAYKLLNHFFSEKRYLGNRGKLTRFRFTLRNSRSSLRTLGEQSCLRATRLQEQRWSFHRHTRHHSGHPGEVYVSSPATLQSWPEYLLTTN